MMLSRRPHLSHKLTSVLILPFSVTHYWRCLAVPLVIKVMILKSPFPISSVKCKQSPSARHFFNLCDCQQRREYTGFGKIAKTPSPMLVTTVIIPFDSISISIFFCFAWLTNRVNNAFIFIHLWAVRVDWTHNDITSTCNLILTIAITLNWAIRIQLKPHLCTFTAASLSAFGVKGNGKWGNRELLYIPSDIQLEIVNTAEAHAHTQSFMHHQLEFKMSRNKSHFHMMSDI